MKKFNENFDLYKFIETLTFLDKLIVITVQETKKTLKINFREVKKIPS